MNSSANASLTAIASSIAASPRTDGANRSGELMTRPAGSG